MQQWHKHVFFFIKTSVNQGIFDLGVLIHLPFSPIFSAYANLTACLCMPFLTIINTQEWHLSFHVSPGVLANRDTRTPQLSSECVICFLLKIHGNITVKIGDGKIIKNLPTDTFS